MSQKVEGRSSKIILTVFPFKGKFNSQKSKLDIYRRSFLKPRVNYGTRCTAINNIPNFSVEWFDESLDFIKRLGRKANEKKHLEKILRDRNVVF